ncbi:hypothetical protein GCM10012275_19080 [Longimycelium tulufanense]|uniref:Uncharacterized protein n=1 Tax=Longimycelium tulufanense TaxID=907463 RepID=A0A8J3CD20_9PSEU|nr:hypothetical protein [Longimycelium tulufanense]GGM48223.1 hypothetical protein GCM10012275_19080 [Longimycelium tulufanense]
MAEYRCIFDPTETLTVGTDESGHVVIAANPGRATDGDAPGVALEPGHARTVAAALRDACLGRVITQDLPNGVNVWCGHSDRRHVAVAVGTDDDSTLICLSTEDADRMAAALYTHAADTAHQNQDDAPDTEHADALRVRALALALAGQVSALIPSLDVYEAAEWIAGNTA